MMLRLLLLMLRMLWLLMLVLATIHGRRGTMASVPMAMSVWRHRRDRGRQRHGLRIGAIGRTGIGTGSAWRIGLLGGVFHHVGCGIVFLF
jgi:hypothetical protein